jgi:hypothetical protein
MILIPIDTISIQCQYDIAITSIRRPRDFRLDIDDDSGGIGRQGVIIMPLYPTEEGKWGGSDGDMALS